MDKILFLIALILYIISSINFILFFLKLNEKFLEYSTKSLIAGFVFHFFNFLIRFIQAKHFPVTTLYEALSFFVLVIVLFQIIIDLKYRVKVIGAFTVFLATLLMIIDFFLPSNIHELPPALQSYWLPIHVIFSFLGNGMFAIACGIGILYLIQLKFLKNKKLTGIFFKLPSLETLDNLNYICLTIGFPLLSLGIITGSIWASSAWGSYWSWDPKETWSLITWFVYAALIHGRINARWRGKKSAIFSIIGFCVVLFTFIGVNLLLPGLHTYANR